MTQALELDWKRVFRDTMLGISALATFYLMVLLPFELGWQFNLFPLLGSILWAQVWMPRMKNGMFVTMASRSGQLVVVSLVALVMVPALWFVLVLGK